MSIAGFFEGWEFDDKLITNGKSVLTNWWFAGGFTDYGGEPLLKGCGIVTRYALWREYKAEVRRRAVQQRIAASEKKAAR